MKTRRTIEVAVLLAAMCVALPGYGDTPFRSEQAGNRSAQVTYDVLSDLSLAERRAVFAQLSSTAKTDLWQLHLDTYIVEHPNLTSAQLAVLEEAMRLLHTGLFLR